ncbi:MAG: 2-hydroxyacid dehydrogenase [Thermoprotei archaeon]
MSFGKDKYVVVALNPLPEAFIRSLIMPYSSELDKEVEVISLKDLSDWDKVVDALSKADVILGDHTLNLKIDEKMVKVMKKVRLIQQPSTGYDNIDIETCKHYGIPVANIGGANAVSVAEYTIMVGLVLLRRLIYAHEKTRSGEWIQWELMNLGTYDLSGKTWGIIGLGRIGREVAKRLKGFDIKVLYYDKVRFSSEVEKELGLEYRELPRLLRESDIVSMHVPLTSETRRMISEKELRMMKPGAILINPSRGEIVDEEALAKALKEGWLGGTAVDVYSVEPPSKEHPLLKLESANLILTPHIAGATSDSRARIIDISIKNVIRVLKGLSPENIVNM